MKYLITTLFIIFSYALAAQPAPETVLVISGGGARGAWGGGVAQTLVTQQGNDYHTVVGTSTGSLLAPFILLKDFEDLKRFYTTVDQRDIFNSNPFNKRGGIKGFSAFLKVLFGAKTLGKSKNLRKLIDRRLPIDVYEQVLDSGNFVVTVVNFNTGEIAYFDNHTFDTRKIDTEGLSGRKLKKALEAKENVRNQFLDWMWASANQPVLMSLYSTKNAQGEKEYWVDGGIRENVAIVKGLEKLLPMNGSDATAPDSVTLDVIVNNTMKPQLRPFTKPRILTGLFHTLDILSFDTRANDTRIPTDITQDIPNMGEVISLLQQCQPERGDKVITVNLYFMKQETLDISPQSLLFQPDKMTQLWNAGVDFSNSAEQRTYTITRQYGRQLIKAFKETH